MGLEPDRAFREVGFDSMTAVELRNRLRAASGVQLPASVVFDYPTPAVLARHLRDQLVEGGGSTAAPLLAELERLDGARHQAVRDSTGGAAAVVTKVTPAPGRSVVRARIALDVRNVRRLS
ncbi:acyl carrier protein [Micromonospora sp. RTGN7]|uniref:acyl carrier protein n=1 Tax=Micromonospora sp. RTGN7 TaxID=3016526 RepID=UPI0029FF0B47|nr:acyl carrier protein [Micromonospora sp. RTGN7]